MKVFLRKIYSLFKERGGYTLTELSISTSIIAMLAVGGLAVLQKKNDSDKYKETYTKIAVIDNAVKSFIIAKNYVPCPAFPSTLENSTTFGKSVSYDATNKICNGSDLADQTGIVPVRTLGLTDDYSYDGWGRKFMFRSASGSGSATDFIAPNFRGNIAIVDLKGVHKTTITDPHPYNDGAIYVIISYGANGKNVAYRKNNDTEPPSAASGIEAKNTSHKENVYVQNEKTSAFDDIVLFGTNARLHNQKITESPIKIPDITCDTAQQIVSGGRSATTLNNYATSNSNAYVSHADIIYKSSTILADLCKNRKNTETIKPDRINGLKLWLDAGDAATLFTNSNCTAGGVPANNASISCWKDKSGNAYNAIAGNAPTYSVNAINGKAVLSFNGTSNYLDNSTFALSTTASIFAVASPGAGSGFKRIISNHANFYLGAGNATNYFSSFYGNGSSWGTTADHGATGLLDTGKYYILTSIKDATYDSPYINGSALAARINAMSAFSDGYRVGANNDTLNDFWDGNIGEILIYNTNLSESNRQKVGEYLSNKWAIPLNAATKTCDTGMTFQRTSSDPAGSCKCPPGQQFVADLKTNNACFSTEANTHFSKCVSVNSSPTYSSPPSTNNMVLWLDANDCTKVTLSGSGTIPHVTGWMDKSPLGNHATQTTLANMPTYLKNTVNGKAVIHFDGSSSYLGNTTLALPTTASIFAVASTGSATGNKRIINNEVNFNLSAGATTTNYFASFYGNNSTWGFESDHGAAGIMSSGAYYILTSVNSGSDNAYINGTALPVRTNAMSAFSNGYRVGAHQAAVSELWDGNIGEIIIYNTAITNQERSNIEKYLSFKWGVPLLPTDIEKINFADAKGASLTLWLDASDTTTLFTDENCVNKAYASDLIGCWKDKSGNNYHAKQVENRARPAYSFGTQTSQLGTTIISNPTLLFNGTSDYMDNANLALPAKVSIFAVAAQGAAHADIKRIISNHLNFLIGVTTASKFMTRYSNGSNWAGSNIVDAVLDDYTYYVLTSINDGTNNNADVNGGTSNTDANAMAAFSDGYRIGANAAAINELWDGNIGEIIIYNTNLSASNRIAVQRYLANKWGVAITVP